MNHTLSTTSLTTTQYIVVDYAGNKEAGPFSSQEAAEKEQAQLERRGCWGLFVEEDHSNSQTELTSSHQEM